MIKPLYKIKGFIIINSMKIIKITMLSVFLLIIILMLGEFTYTRLDSTQDSKFSTVYLTHCSKAKFTEAMKTIPDVGGAVFFTSDCAGSNYNRQYRIFYAGISEKGCKKC